MYLLMLADITATSSEVAKTVETGWSPANIVTLVAAIIAAVVSIIGIFIQMYLSEKTIKADVVSKTRIEWNKELRKVTSDIIHLSFMLNRILSTYLNENQTIEKANAICTPISPLYSNDELSEKLTISSLKLSEEFDQMFEDFTNKGYYFNLLFGINDRNQKLISSLNTINDSLNQLVEIRENFQNGTVDIEYSITLFNSKSKELGDVVSNFQNAVKIYLKEEWVQIKQGK